MEDLPPGFRFYPTEEELISFYLMNKLHGAREDKNHPDIYLHNPWDLPEFAGDLSSRDPEQWFFFIPRQESEARGGRPKRLTTTGFWKATGSPGHVYSQNRSNGMKRTMVFNMGRAPDGRKTEWKMNEYKAIRGEASSASSIAAPSMDFFGMEASTLHSMNKYVNLEKQSDYGFGQSMHEEHLPRKIMFLEQSIHCMKADNDLEKQSDSGLEQDTGTERVPKKETKRSKDMAVEARKHDLEPTPPHPTSSSIFQEDIAHSLLLIATVFASMSLLGASLTGHGTSGSSSSAVKLGLLVWLNSVVFFSSLGLIVFLLHKLPIMPWLLITVSSAIGVYMCAVKANSPDEVVPVIWIGSSIFLAAFMQNAYNCTHWVRTKFLRLSII